MDVLNVAVWAGKLHRPYGEKDVGMRLLCFLNEQVPEETGEP